LVANEDSRPALCATQTANGVELFMRIAEPSCNG